MKSTFYNHSSADCLSAADNPSHQYCRFDLFTQDRYYLFSLIISSGEIIIRLPEKLEAGLYNWQVSGIGEERSGLLKIPAASSKICISTLLSEECIEKSV